MRSIAGLWRWRHNRLLRGTDRVEGWLALGAALLIVVAAPAAGLWGWLAAHDTLMETVREQQRERQRVWATVAESVAHQPVGADPETAPEGDADYRVVVTWTGADGSTHTGAVTRDRAIEAGNRLRVWIDARGDLTSRPMDAATASSHALLAGFGAAGIAIGLVEAVRQLAVGQLMRRRYARWDEEWARVGPDWGRTGRSN